MKHKTLLAVIICISAGLCGCATISESSQKILGISQDALYAAREKGKGQVFDYDYKTCYDKVISVLKEMKAYIYLHSFKKQRIVAMNFKDFNNTTEVGIFFSEITPSTTKVEISCLSPSVLEGVSTRIFSALKGEKPQINKPINK